MSFLTKLNKKTTEVVERTLRPNMTQIINFQGFKTKCTDITQYVMSLTEYEKLISRLDSGFYIITPRESLMGYIEGYNVYNLAGKKLLVFGLKNFPENSMSSEEIFIKYCKTKRNMTLSYITGTEIKDNFSEYCY